MSFNFVIYGRLHDTGMAIKNWPLVQPPTDSTSSPFPSQKFSRGGTKVPILIKQRVDLLKAVPNLSWDPKVMSLT